MSLATDTRARGFAALLAFNGETLTFRGSPLLGLVDRSARPQQNLQEIGLSLLPASTIELRKLDLASNPLLDEVFIDAEGYRHRIRLIQQTAFTWKLTCMVSGV